MTETFYHATTEKKQKKVLTEGFKIPNESKEMQWGLGVYFDTNLPAICHHWGAAPVKVEIPVERCKNIKAGSKLHEERLSGSFDDFIKYEETLGRGADRGNLWKRYQRKGKILANKMRKRAPCILSKWNEAGELTLKAREMGIPTNVFERTELVIYNEKMLKALRPKPITCPKMEKYEKASKQLEEIQKGR